MTQAKKTASAPAPPPGEGYSPVSRKTLLNLYAAMLKARILDGRLVAMARLGRLGAHYTRAHGHEAAFAAVSLALGARDTLAPTRHGLIPTLIRRGLNGQKMLLGDLLATVRRPAPAPSFSAALKASIALARARRRSVNACFCTTGELVSPAARALVRNAGQERLPIVFVALTPPAMCGASFRNFYSGFPVIPVDGQDAVAVFRVASEAVAHARRGNGPTLIPCLAWPLPDGENGDHRRPCSLANMERYLAVRGWFEAGCSDRIARRYARELDAFLQKTAGRTSAR